MAFITKKMYLMSLTYCEMIRSVIEKIGISDSAVIAKLMPRYKYKNERGVEFGKDRCDRFMYWSKWRWYNEDDYYDRCKAVEDYVRLIYPRLVREVAKEEAKAKFLANLETSFVQIRSNLPRFASLIKA